MLFRSESTAKEPARNIDAEGNQDRERDRTMSKQKNQGCTRSNPGAAIRKAQARYAAQCRRFRRSIVALIRGWVRSGIVANLNQVAVELNRRAVPQLEGSKGWQRSVLRAVGAGSRLV